MYVVEQKTSKGWEVVQGDEWSPLWALDAAIRLWMDLVEEDVEARITFTAELDDLRPDSELRGGPMYEGPYQDLLSACRR